MMKDRIGTYIIKKFSGESFKAYIPPKFPPKPKIDLEKLFPLLEKAINALSELNTITKSIPNPSLFIYMYTHTE
jgi:hypothetical protein